MRWWYLTILLCGVIADACYWSGPPKSADTLENNAYGREENAQDGRLPDSLVANQTGYIMSDPGNLIGQCRSCEGSCWYQHKKDVECVAKTIRQVWQNGGIPMAYMSLTIEPDREDVVNSTLEKGVDYTDSQMSGWPEYGPKLTPKYKKLMYTRIVRISQSGYIGVEFDNVDILYNCKDTGISHEDWQKFVLNLTMLACKLGLVPIQKNTVEDWTCEHLTKFKFGAIMLELHQLPQKYDMYWDQVQYYADHAFPIFITYYDLETCDQVLSSLGKLVKIKDTSPVLVDCQYASNG